MRMRDAVLVMSFLLQACASRLPDEPPPLADMEEPLSLFAEPDDEAARAALPLGSFTGCEVGAAGDSLESLLEAAHGVQVQAIVENSPADVAGLKVGDLLLHAKLADGSERDLTAESDWRKVELDAAPGSVVTISFDRANRHTSTTLTLVPRMHLPARTAVRRVREEKRVGVVLRTATEVESRAAGLGPGAGAVIVGLSARSPWRHAGLRFGDLVTAVDGAPVSDPEAVLDAIRDAKDRTAVAYVREGKALSADAPLTRRARDTREVYVPLLFDYEYDRGKTDTSILLGLFRHEHTRAAWRVRLLWFIRFGRGDADQLIEVDR
ncbi:MAG: hypothetical protein U1F36_02220 [Planctomycetota bacterium]